MNALQKQDEQHRDDPFLTMAASTANVNKRKRNMEKSVDSGDRDRLDVSDGCSPSIDRAWFQLTKLFGDPRNTEEELVLGTARLIPSFCLDPDKTGVSISLGGEECHYTSRNLSNEHGNATWIDSIEIPASHNACILGRIHLFHLQHDTVSQHCHSFASTCSTESCTSHHSLEGGANADAPLSASLPESLEEAERGRETGSHCVETRVHMVAELLGDALSHRRDQAERNRFFEESNDLHAALIVNEYADKDLRFDLLNPGWTMTLGWAESDLLGTNWFALIHPDDFVSARRFLKMHQEEDRKPHSLERSSQKSDTSQDGDFHFATKHCFENRVRTKGGKYEWVCWSVIATPNQSRERSNRMMLTGRCFTERKNSEIALKQSQTRLRESQNIARLGQWELDLLDNNLYWSDEIYRLFRVDKRKFGASYEAFLNAIHPDDRDMVNSAYTTSLETRRPYSIAHRLLYDDGTVRWVNEICRTEYDETGKALRSIGTVQDITELRQAQEELRIAKEKAEEADRLKSAFLANMSHEIRTPMNAVIGYTDLMLLDYEMLSKNHREYLEIIKSSGNLLLTLINDILDVSKIEAGQMRLENKAFSLGEILRTVSYNAKGLLSRKRNYKIDLKGPTDSSALVKEVGIQDFIMGDSARVQQILNNLISNAIKFTDAGAVEYGVKLVVGPDSKMLEFRVSDTGVGIPPADQQTIFLPFRQTHATSDSHELGGTGLGLAIARKLVELMGGSIRLESRLGSDHGSTFYFTFPYVPAPRQCASRHNCTPVQGLHPTNAVDAKLTGKILLVDDSKVNLRLAERVIVKMGCSSITANNGHVAVSIFKSDPSINLILMDKEMPEMDGLSATREIRRIELLENRKAIPIIALTAAAMNGDREECLAAGCSDYLPKPLDRKRLHEVLTAYL